jgi:hypothetical protein
MQRNSTYSTTTRDSPGLSRASTARSDVHIRPGTRSTLPSTSVPLESLNFDTVALPVYSRSSVGFPIIPLLHQSVHLVATAS